MRADVLPQGPSLYLLHWQGLPIGHAWTWPEKMDVLHLDELMRTAGLTLAQDMQADAQFWTLRRDSNHPDIPWQLSHQCSTLQCTHNGKILPRGQSIALQEGDFFEAGLCRLGLLYAPLPSIAQASNMQGEGEPLYDLTILADQHVPAWFNDSRSPESDHSLFELLGQEQPERPHDKESPAQAMAEGNSMGVELKDGAPQPDPILQSLHAAYLRHLQDPLGSAQQDDWAAVKTLSRSQTDPLAELKQRGQAKTTLSDLLGLHDGIHHVIEQLPIQGPMDILAQTKPDNVMHLFAPPAWQTNQQRQVPAVNRQDHHGLALDSAMPWHPTDIKSSTP